MKRRPGTWSLDTALRNLCVVLLLVLLTTGCASLVSDRAIEMPGPEDSQTDLVWPPAPAEPRVSYVGSVKGAADLGVRVSLLKGLAGTLTGDNTFHEGFTRPFGIFLDEEGNLCLTDVAAGTVCFFDRKRKKFYRWHEIGKNEFMEPVAIVKKGDCFFVADTGLHKVMAFNTKKKLLFEITDKVQRPCGLAVSGEKLFVSDASSHSILVFDLQGKYLTKFGTRGVSPGRFNFPTHLAAGPEGRIYVTDCMNHRIQVFAPNGRYQGTIGGPGDGSGRFNRPKGVAVDTFGHVYVVDALFDNIQIFDRDGRFLLHLGAAGSGPGEFWLPSGIAIDGNNRIYVSDSYNRRIQVFQYVGGQ